MRQYKYILVGHEPIALDDPLEWAKWYETDFKARIVAQEMVGDFWVSTVFLGLDHCFMERKPPVLFETMVFEAGNSKQCNRYSTWDEAEAGHKKIVAGIRTTISK